MAIQDDFTVAANGDIRRTVESPTPTATYTVIEFHRWLGDLMDDAQASGNDILDITDATASERSTDNIITLNAPYNIDDDAAKYLYDGSIIQAGGDTIYDGIVVFSAPGTYLEIAQNGALITPNYWTSGYNADANNGISHRLMVKVRSGGVDIDGRRLRGLTREWGKTFSSFSINGTARGNNVMALTYADDLNNQTAIGTVAGWSDITNTEGLRLLDVNNDGTDELYYSEWNRAAHSINDLYERAKWLTRRGSTETLYGLNGTLFRGITHQVPILNVTGSWNPVEAVTWSGGTGQVLAHNVGESPDADQKLWIQLTTGVAPTNGQTISTTGSPTATCQVNGSPTARSLSTPFIGQSTGSAIIGGYGVGIEVLDLSASDKLFDLTNTQRTPPNYVTFTVGGLIAGEDRVLVGPALAGALDTAQFSLDTALTGGAETQIDVNATIPSDTPATGTVRIQLNSGIWRRVPYTSYATDKFTIAPTDFTGDNASASNNVFISYIDDIAPGSPTGDPSSMGFTGVYVSDRSLFVRVRDGGATPIKTFETTGTLGSAGGSATAIRTSDS
jgi:hypothetical protein